MKKIILMMAVLTLTLGLGACDSDANVAFENLRKEADHFQIMRRVVFINNITGDYILELTGNCSIDTDVVRSRLELICKTGEKEFKMHYFGLSDNTSYLVEQLDWVESNQYQYILRFKPSTIVPIIEMS